MGKRENLPDSGNCLTPISELDTSEIKYRMCPSDIPDKYSKTENKILFMTLCPLMGHMPVPLERNIKCLK